MVQKSPLCCSHPLFQKKKSNQISPSNKSNQVSYQQGWDVIIIIINIIINIIIIIIIIKKVTLKKQEGLKKS